MSSGSAAEVYDAARIAATQRRDQQFRTASAEFDVALAGGGDEWESLEKLWAAEAAAEAQCDAAEDAAYAAYLAALDAAD